MSTGLQTRNSQRGNPTDSAVRGVNHLCLLLRKDASCLQSAIIRADQYRKSVFPVLLESSDIFYCVSECLDAFQVVLSHVSNAECFLPYVTISIREDIIVFFRNLPNCLSDINVLSILNAGYCLGAISLFSKEVKVLLGPFLCLLCHFAMTTITRLMSFLKHVLHLPSISKHNRNSGGRVSLAFSVVVI